MSEHKPIPPTGGSAITKPYNGPIDCGFIGPAQLQRKYAEHFNSSYWLKNTLDKINSSKDLSRRCELGAESAIETYLSSMGMDDILKLWISIRNKKYYELEQKLRGDLR